MGLHTKLSQPKCSKNYKRGKFSGVYFKRDEIPAFKVNGIGKSGKNERDEQICLCSPLRRRLIVLEKQHICVFVGFN